MTSVLTLVNGKTDVAAVGETIVPALVRSKQLREGEVRYLWISPRIPEGPVAVRQDLPRDFKEKLTDALVRMQSEAPDAYLNMTAKVYRERYRNTKFIPATDAVFDPLRELARGMKLTQLLE
jgi:phosphonate transport system substrate-binding protein